MVKKMLCLVALVAFIFTLAAVAGQKPVMSVRDNVAKIGNPATLKAPWGGNGQSVPYCNPCAVYGGDLNPSDPNANGLASEKDLAVSDAEVYVPFKVKKLKGKAAFGNFLTLACTGGLDPKQADWDIRTGITEGNGGTSVVSGTTAATITATGRNAFGLPECTVSAKANIALNAANTYYMTVVPYCTNSGNSVCASGQRFFMSDTQAPFNNKVGNWPKDGSFFNSTYFGFTWGNITNDGVCGGIGCSWFSAGIVGKAK
jgi:hypothetical protein